MIQMHADDSLKRRRGITLAEVLVAIGVMSLLLALFGPAVQQIHERSRRHTCQNHIRQLGISAYTHETFHQTFPYTARNSGSHGTIFRSVSPHRAMMHFLDPTIAAKIDSADDTVDFVHPSNPTLSQNTANRALLRITIPVLLCPSDRTVAGATSYRANYGISPGVFRFNNTPYREASARQGAFVNAESIRPDEFTDGLSTTALFSERVLGDGNPKKYDAWRDRFAAPMPFYTALEALSACQSHATTSPSHHDSFGGYNWLLGGPRQTWYDHIAVPNSPIPDCTMGPAMSVGGGHGLMTARSNHDGGVNVCFADGAVRFVTGHIELQVWRAIGTRNGEEIVDQQAY